MARLLSFTLLAHKYRFSDIENFGFELISRDCMRWEYIRHKTCPVLHCRKILQLCTLMHNAIFLDHVARDILFLSQQIEIEGDLVDLLGIAEDFHLREIQGMIYYRILKSAVSASFSNNHSMDFLPCIPITLNDTQKKNLQTGFISLLGVSEHLKMNGWDALIDETICNCRMKTMKGRCQSARLGVVRYTDKEVRSKTFAYDILGHLELMKDEDIHEGCPSYDTIPAPCQSMLLSDITKEEKKYKAALAGYFL